MENEYSKLNHCVINPDYKWEWEKMILNNDPNIDFQEPFKRFSSIKRNFVELIMNICEELDLSPEIEFTCLDNFDVFAYRHFISLAKKTIPIIKNNSSSAEKVWQKTLKVVGSQFMLRTMSLVSICAKHHNANLNISLIKIQDLLRIAGCPSILKEIQASEFRVFFTLGYQIVQPKTYESLTVLLIKCVELPFYSNIFCEISIRILRFTYLQRDDIYKGLIPLIQEQTNLYEIMCDQNLIASAIILTTAKVINLNLYTISILTKLLSDESSNEENDISTLSELIFNNVKKFSTSDFKD